MKQLYILFIAMGSFQMLSAQNLVVTLDKDSVCTGGAVTATVHGPTLQLVSPASGTNNQNGVMFDVTATSTAIIKGFTATPTVGGTNFKVYYRTGSHVGFENSATGWTLLDSSSGIAAGTAVNIGVNLSQSIVAGQTLAFYITCTNVSGTNYIQYVNGTAVGTTLASDSYLTLKEGIGKSYPFGSTYTPRSFIGSILYEPALTNISWNVKTGSGLSINFNPTRSVGVVASATVGGNVATGYANLNVKEIEVTAKATPATISSGQSSTLSSEVTLKRGLITLFGNYNSQNGAMFDIAATKAVDISGFSISAQGTGNMNVEIFYKTGTFVGSEGTASAWTSLGTFTGVSDKQSTFIPLTSKLAMVAGQTMGFYITRTDNGLLYYDDGTTLGAVFVSDGVLSIKEGKGIKYPFGSTFSPRVLNTVVHYEVKNPSGLTYTWAPGGGSSGSKTVSPTATTTYTVSVKAPGNCTETATVKVTVNNIGIDEEFAKNILVFPNPAKDYINVSFTSPLKDVQIYVSDIAGKRVYQSTLSGQTESTQISVSNLALGMYMLQIISEGETANYKIQIQ